MSEGLDILLLFCIVGNGEIFSGKPPKGSIPLNIHEL